MRHRSERRTSRLRRLADWLPGRAPPPATRVAVLGLYRSGSTAAAGVLHHLGVEMGAPFYGDFFESRGLSEELRAWWEEPHLKERVSPAKRVRMLARWVRQLERETGARWVGFKHPLLCLCGDDLIAAWGESTRLIWTYRPLEQSIRSLAKTDWFPDGERVQHVLWDAAHAFFADREHLRIEFSAMMSDPAGEIERIVAYLGLHPRPEQREAALRSIRPRSRE